MFSNKLPYLLCAAAVVVSSGCATTSASSSAVIRAKNKVAPALVHVAPVREVFRRGERQEVAVSGSGFIISPDGYVVTNEHVAGKESNFVRCVLSNKEEVEAQIVGVDKFTDIAVLKLDTDRTDLPYVRLGSSSDLEAGVPVLALGSPHGLSRSVSMGIISVTDRNLESFGREIAPYNNWIQTDAAINPGNSGGPLVNLRGEVVGINTRKLTGADNIGFAIPIDFAKEVIDEIIANGRVVRSSIGVRFQEMRSTTDDPDRPGVVVGDVSPISPAYAAGLQPGDVILEIDGTPTNARFEEDLPSVRKIVADLPLNEPATLLVRRGEEEVELEVLTEEQAETEGDQIEFEEWGFTAANLNPQIRRVAGLESGAGGVFVSGVQRGSLAAQAGLANGDVILSLDEEPVADMSSFIDDYELRLSTRQRLVLFVIKRGALSQFKLLKQEFGDADDS